MSEHDDSDDDARDARHSLSCVDVTPGYFRGMPLWSVDYTKQLNREKIQANYLSVVLPILSPPLEASMWGAVEDGLIQPSKLQTPSVTEFRNVIPRNSRKWHYDDSEDEAEEVAEAEAAAKAKAEHADMILIKRKEIAVKKRKDLMKKSIDFGFESSDSEEDGESDQASDSESDNESKKKAASDSPTSKKKHPKHKRREKGGGKGVGLPSEDSSDSEGSSSDGGSGGVKEVKKNKGREDESLQSSSAGGGGARAKGGGSFVGGFRPTLESSLERGGFGEGGEGEEEGEGQGDKTEEEFQELVGDFFNAAKRGDLSPFIEALEAMGALEKNAGEGFLLKLSRRELEDEFGECPVTPSLTSTAAVTNSTAATSMAATMAAGPPSGGGRGSPSGGGGGCLPTGKLVDLTDRADSDDTTARGFTALMYACLHNHVRLLTFLVKKCGASLSVVDGQGMTCLHVACCEGHDECVQLLVQYACAAGTGREGPTEGLGFEIFRGHEFNDAVSRKEKLLIIAAQERSDRKFELLEASEQAKHEAKHAQEVSDALAAPNHKPQPVPIRKRRPLRRPVVPGVSKNGTALYWAAAHGHLKVVQFLVDKYKPFIDDAFSEEGDSPLWIACFQKRRDVALFLLNNGADATISNHAGITIVALIKMWGIAEERVGGGLEAMAKNASFDSEFAAALKSATENPNERTLLRKRETELAQKRKLVAPIGDPEPGPGVGVFLFSIPDKRKSTLKRSVPFECTLKQLFDLADVHMADKCGLDCLYGFDLHVTSVPARVLKMSLVGEELLSDINFAPGRVTLEVHVSPKPDNLDGNSPAAEGPRVPSTPKSIAAVF